MAEAASRAGRAWRGAVLTTRAADLLCALARLFENTAPGERTRLAQWVVLAGLTSLGGVLRFWGLGLVGLHGDEETMAMATAGILDGGLPILPSGMVYPRGLTQLYMMALSVQAFGESEWALRLPSALWGTALIPLAFVAGRRFLRPHWSLALAGAVAFLPDLIVFSQTARMYIMLLAGIAVFMCALFAWERTDRVGWLIAAIGALVISIELHTLAVTCALLFLLPGMLQGNLRKLGSGVLAVAIVVVAYLGIQAWLDSQYPVPPPEYAADFDHQPRQRLAAGKQPFATPFAIALWGAGLAVAFCAVQFTRGLRRSTVARVTLAALLAGIVAQLLLFYHVAGLFYLCALVLALRNGGGSAANVYRLAIVALGIATIGLVHASLLAARPGSFVQLVGAMVGQPSVWPYVRIAQFSWGAGLLTAAAIGWSLYRLTLRKPVADYVLLALLAVWIPLIAIGFFVWNMPPRYASASLLPMLICAFAFAQTMFDGLSRWSDVRGKQALYGGALAAALCTVMVIDPRAAAATVNAGYGRHPDHKGAAEFMRRQGLTPEDVVLAEDVLQQTYYLGSVDYWLISRKYSRTYVIHADGAYRDFYTGTEVMSDAARLEALLANAPARVFVIGSGENQHDGRLDMRGAELHRLLEESGRFEVLHVGRDGLTKVWRARNIGRPAAVDRLGRRAPGAAAHADGAEARPAVVPRLDAQPRADSE